MSDWSSDVCSSDLAIVGALAFEELVALALDPVRAVRPGCKVAAAGALPAAGHVHVQQQGQAGLQADHAAFELGDETCIQPASAALVGVARIGEAVADQPRAAFKRWQDRERKSTRLNSHH